MKRAPAGANNNHNLNKVLKWTSLLCGAMNGWSSIMIEATLTLLSLRFRHHYPHRSQHPYHHPHHPHRGRFHPHPHVHHLPQMVPPWWENAGNRGSDCNTDGRTSTPGTAFPQDCSGSALFVPEIRPEIQKKYRNTEISKSFFLEIWKALKNPVVLTPADLQLLFLFPRYGQKSKNNREIQKSSHP